MILLWVDILVHKKSNIIGALYRPHTQGYEIHVKMKEIEALPTTEK